MGSDLKRLEDKLNRGLVDHDELVVDIAKDIINRTFCHFIPNFLARKLCYVLRNTR